MVCYSRHGLKVQNADHLNTGQDRVGALHGSVIWMFVIRIPTVACYLNVLYIECP